MTAWTPEKKRPSTKMEGQWLGWLRITSRPTQKMLVWKASVSTEITGASRRSGHPGKAQARHVHGRGWRPWPCLLTQLRPLCRERASNLREPKRQQTCQDKMACSSLNNAGKSCDQFHAWKDWAQKWHFRVLSRKVLERNEPERLGQKQKLRVVWRWDYKKDERTDGPSFSSWQMTVTHGTVELAGLKNSGRASPRLATRKQRSTQTEGGVGKGHQVDSRQSVPLRHCEHTTPSARVRPHQRSSSRRKAPPQSRR